MIWTSWVEPLDNLVDFHRPEMFGALTLKPQEELPASYAARLLATRTLRLLRSPQLSLEGCPKGSLLVKARYASLCGSDFPYFRAAAK